MGLSEWRFMPPDIFARWVVVSVFIVIFMLYAAIDAGLDHDGILYFLVLSLFCCFCAGTIAVLLSNVGSPEYVDDDDKRTDRIYW